MQSRSMFARMEDDNAAQSGSEREAEIMEPTVVLEESVNVKERVRRRGRSKRTRRVKKMLR